MERFDRKKVLVTGASGGIGRAVVSLFRSEGAVVAASDLDLDGVEAEVKIEGDLLDGGFADRLARHAAGAMDGLDILVNNAGIIRRGPVTETTDEDFRLSMAVNVEAPFRISRAAIPLMAEAGGGVIVNTASCWGLRPGPNHAIYCGSKAAIAALTQCMGRDHAHQGVRINAVCPNEVDTPMLRSGFAIRGLDPEHAIESLDESVPLGRIAQPEDIADVIAFLASDAARYMCGALVEVNGGKPVS